MAVEEKPALAPSPTAVEELSVADIAWHSVVTMPPAGPELHPAADAGVPDKSSAPSASIVLASSTRGKERGRDAKGLLRRVR
jgi:hypothetical protein